MQINRLLTVFLILTMSVAFSCNAKGNDEPFVYVSKTRGADKNIGTKDKPVRSLQKAFQIKSKWLEKNAKSDKVYSVYIEGTLDKKDYQWRHVLINSYTEGYNGAVIFDFAGQDCDGFTLEDDDWLNMKNVTIRNAQTGIRIWDSTGGYYNDYATHVILTNCTIENCSNSAIIVGPESHAELSNCTFQNNTSEYSGGGIAANGSSLIINGCTFRNNTAQKNGGAISMEHAAEKNFLGYEITDCTFSGNKAENGFGGAIFSIDDSFTPLKFDFVVKNSVFENNVGAYCGGIVVNYGLNLITANCTISGSRSTSNYGAVLNYGGTIKGSFKFADNQPENLTEVTVP